jgi:2-polyprenyl-3-methyl-5-hydroxy-6-metoxy-1,4-benzoquinol methylase
MDLKGSREILSNVRYLQNIRPIDPEEIEEYISGSVGVDLIRSEIRDNAFRLGLVERFDGKFTPVSEDPIGPRVVEVLKIPEKYSARLEDILREKYGKEWQLGESGETIRERIRGIKKDYYEGRGVEYDEENALAYAAYHFPGYYVAIQHILNKISEGGLLKRKLRILDVGAGIGGPALGISDYIPENALVEYNAVEPSQAADILQILMEERGANVHLNIHRETAEKFEPSGVYDIVLFANVISELENPISVVNKYSKFVSKTGAMILVAPADKNTAIELREVERAISSNMNIYVPAISLWPGQVPCSECWSFEVMPDIEIPSFQEKIDRGGQRKGEFVNIDVQVAYSILRWDSQTLFRHPGDISRCVKLSDIGTRIGKRVDIIVVKLSQDLSEGQNSLFLVGDGSEKIDNYIVIVKETPQNRVMAEAEYGRIVLIRDVLVLWNEDETSYNLIVDKETTVQQGLKGSRGDESSDTK